MRILGIETSCDETALACAEFQDGKLTTLWSDIASQMKKHAEFGGVVPEVAARLHLELLSTMLQARKDEIVTVDAIAVTAGPGLKPALRSGIEAAKTLAWTLQKPLIAVSHLEGHVYANWLDQRPPALPALVLLVSGGHTELALMGEDGSFTLLGETLDDAVGEAFDKVAKMLSLGYPGGPAISKLAKEGDRAAFAFPRGFANEDHLNFSYSGLKTSVLYTLRKHEDQLGDLTFRANIAASFEAAAIDALMIKTRKALEKHEVKSLLLGGGVTANGLLRARTAELADEFDVDLRLPELKLTGDNAIMIAAAGAFHLEHLSNPFTLEARSTWPLGS
ncbi:MAG: tRNA (adenosine(37)-N6)-threonylcarbamoyltransferase complex transferase subunit TsaD [bacterium]|nr:tRNA (adenosine(37)-N6)-threonylcarbamoyltransferase complex transferase subunit TsaD [bacterium]